MAGRSEDSSCRSASSTEELAEGHDQASAAGMACGRNLPTAEAVQAAEGPGHAKTHIALTSSIQMLGHSAEWTLAVLPPHGSQPTTSIRLCGGTGGARRH